MSVTTTKATSDIHDVSLSDSVGAMINGDVTQPMLDSTSVNIETCNTGPQKHGRWVIYFLVVESKLENCLLRIS